MVLCLGLAGFFLTLAGILLTVALTVTGEVAWACGSGAALCFFLAGVFACLAVAAHFERWPFRPEPPPPWSPFSHRS
jgi:hypothetical protein